MYVETSMYIRNDLLEKLDEAAGKMDMSRSRLVSMLLIKYMEQNKAGGKVFMKLQYQERDNNAGFTTKSLCLRKDVYERWGDVRKAFKFSASLIIALAIELYLDEMLKGEGLPHNYEEMYVSMSKYSGKAYIHIMIWGVPNKKRLKKLYQA